MHANTHPPVDYLNSFFFSALAKKGFAGGGIASLFWSLIGPREQQGKQKDAGWPGRCRRRAESSGQLETSSGPLVESEMPPASSGSLPEHGQTVILGYFVQLSTDWC